MELRIMNLMDIDEVLALEKELYTCPWDKETLIENINNQYAFNYILSENDEIIGYFSIWIVDDYATVNKITIKASYQGKKYGNILMNHLIDLCLKKGCICIDLEVEDSNIIALSLYKKNGFEITDTIEDYYGKGKSAINMVKVLKKEGKRYEKIHISN